MTPGRRWCCLAAVLAAVPPGLAGAEDQNPAYEFSGPYRAEVVRVVDGDTVLVTVSLWPNLTAEVAARVRGVDAPEIFSPACATEAALGRDARAYVEERYAPGDIVQLRDVGRDSFFGRVVADVRRWRSDRWLPLSTELLTATPVLAVPWEPGQTPVPWCLLTQP